MKEAFCEAAARVKIFFLLLLGIQPGCVKSLPAHERGSLSILCARSYGRVLEW